MNKEVVIQVGDAINGHVIKKIERDPFKPSQINLWTEEMTIDAFGDRGVLVYRVSQGDNLTEEEHSRIINELAKRYVGKYILEPDGEYVMISNVLVDYKKNAQHMNRVVDEYGNIHFIDEISVLYIKEEKE